MNNYHILTKNNEIIHSSKEGDTPGGWYGITGALNHGEELLEKLYPDKYYWVRVYYEFEYATNYFTEKHK